MKYVKTTQVESWLEAVEGDIEDERDALFFDPDVAEEEGPLWH